MKNLFLILILITAFLACQKPTKTETLSRNQAIKGTTKDYFATFAQRTDWEKLCSFYREDLQFKDVLLQLELDSLWQFKRFYKWDEEGDRFKKLTPDQEHLTVTSLVVNDSIAVASGRVNPFYYDGNLIDTDWGMDFTIWLYFDEELKIKKQIDWFEYDSYTLENMIARCRENGFEATPEWLDLSKDKS